MGLTTVQRDCAACDKLEQSVMGQKMCFGDSYVFFGVRIKTTAELGRALAVVKVTLQVNGNTQFSGVDFCQLFFT